MIAGIARASDPEDIAAELLERYGVGVLALTLGAEGAALFADGKSWREHAPAIELRDTTGAGDAFLGGLLAGMRHGLGWGDALKLATSAGACCCERVGGFPDEPGSCRARTLTLYAEASGRPLPEAPAADDSAEPATRRFLGVATDELAAAARALDPAQLARAADLILSAEANGGRVHVTGVGKPEHVARYSAALLASTGPPGSMRS